MVWAGCTGPTSYADRRYTYGYWVSDTIYTRHTVGLPLCESCFYNSTWTTQTPDSGSVPTHRVGTTRLGRYSSRRSRESRPSRRTYSLNTVVLVRHVSGPCPVSKPLSTITSSFPRVTHTGWVYKGLKRRRCNWCVASLPGLGETDEDVQTMAAAPVLLYLLGYKWVGEYMFV